VDLDEFLAAMTDWSTLESRLQESDSTMYDVLLEEVFQIFDTDNSGQLNVDEVSAVRVVVPLPPLTLAPLREITHRCLPYGGCVVWRILWCRFLDEFMWSNPTLRSLLA
jgi:hypothetical protein